MKLSVFYDHIKEAEKQSNLAFAEILKEVRKAGITGIEINFSCLKENKEKILEELKTAGLCISSIYELYNWGNKPDLSYAKEHVDLAVEVGAEKILVVPGFVSKSEERQLTRYKDDPLKLFAYMEHNVKIRRMKENLNELVSYAKKQSTEEQPLFVTLEDFDYKLAPYRRAEELKYFMEQVPGLRYTFDSGNFAYSDEDAQKAYELLKPYIVHVHCKDREREKKIKYLATHVNKGLASVAVGSGYMPVEKVVYDLLRSGYDGYFAIEHFGAKNQMETIKASAEKLKKYFK